MPMKNRDLAHLSKTMSLYTSGKAHISISQLPLFSQRNSDKVNRKKDKHKIIQNPESMEGGRGQK